MNAEQKQRAMQRLRRFSQANPRTLAADNAAVDMAALLQELIDTSEPEPVAWLKEWAGPSGEKRWRFDAYPDIDNWMPNNVSVTPLYTAPPANNQSEQPLEMGPPPAPSVPDTDLARDAERWLSQRDLELLVTFGLQAEDCDADGHTLSKEQTRRLCELGVLRNVGFGRSEMTSFGCVLFDQHWEQSRSLPLRTHAEYAALAAKKGGA